MQERYDDGDGVPDLAPAVRGVPAEAQRMGLSRHTEEGALVEFASALDGAKPAHRMIAWVMLLAFIAPAVLAFLVAIF
jgi:hypothetical protein